MMLIGDEPQSYPSYRDIALSADATNDAFDIGILPRAPRCAGTVFHSQSVHAFSKAISVNRIAITQ